MRLFEINWKIIAFILPHVHVHTFSLYSQIDDEVETKQQPVAKPFPPDLFDSDSDLSDTERLILERRRLNTEYMEQIEKERLERAPKQSEEEESVSEASSPEKTVREPEEKKDVMEKTLEELEAERDALLQAVRNPEPPSLMDVEEEAAKTADDVQPELSKIKAHVDSDEENLEARRAKKEKVGVEVNGDVTLAKGLSESSAGEGSPCGQVRHSFNAGYVFFFTAASTVQ